MEMESNPNPPVEGRQSQEATRCPTNREKQSLTYSQQPMDRSPKRSQNCTSSELSRGEKANDPGSAGRPGRTLMPLASTCRTNNTVASALSFAAQKGRFSCAKTLHFSAAPSCLQRRCSVNRGCITLKPALGEVQRSQPDKSYTVCI